MSALYPLKVKVNGRGYNLEVPADMRLVDLLRGSLGLMGTRTGCDSAQCGACTIHKNGEPVRACAQFALQANGASLTTIEGVGQPDQLHVMQAAFRKHHALQCGYCTSGMIMTAVALVERESELDEEKVRKALKGNICRCTGYHNIVRAILDGAALMQNKALTGARS